MDPATIFINLGHATYVGSSALRRTTWLRSVLVVSSGSFIAFGVVANIPSVVAWNAAFGLCNLWHLLGAARRRRSRHLPEDGQRVYRALAPSVEADDFTRLWYAGWPERRPAGDRFRTRDDDGDLMLVVDGGIDIEVDDTIVGQRRTDDIICQSALTAAYPGRDVWLVAAQPTTVRRWSPDRLVAIEQACPGLTQALRTTSDAERWDPPVPAR